MATSIIIAQEYKQNCRCQGGRFARPPKRQWIFPTLFIPFSIPFHALLTPSEAPFRFDGVRHLWENMNRGQMVSARTAKETRLFPRSPLSGRSPLFGDRQILTEMTRNFSNPSYFVKFGKACSPRDAFIPLILAAWSIEGGRAIEGSPLGCSPLPGFPVPILLSCGRFFDN